MLHADVARPTFDGDSRTSRTAQPARGHADKGRMHAAENAETFYRQLLTLDTFVAPEPLVDESVRLITEITGARLGYVEFFPIEAISVPPYRRAFCDGGPADIDGWVSRDIIHAAVEERATINLASAVAHPRFRASTSVVANAIRAVLCTPIGVGAPVGVVYVQGRELPGRFPDIDRERAEIFAARLSTVSDRIRFASNDEHITLDDEVRWLEERTVRASLDRNAGNLSGTARELGITRARLYRILRRT